VGADGSLTGYAGGLDKKTALLRLEGAGSLSLDGQEAESAHTGLPKIPNGGII
jgi:hypothetical protein